ncbi:PIN domain-containing protein [Yimella sp. NH-Cas1]|uniref:PIN domain-containing protein n=1 Tax=Yimella sp. NH-Cas1 TaxID=2917726 RepID=UPI001EFA5D2A|nr:PIN domain-containing protein [Yimella sp. NH-Cas1]
MYRAVLDTCALVPGQQRDFLLQLATERAYAPLWSTGTLDELDYVLARLDERRGRADRAAYRKRLLAQMASVFPGATIEAARDRAYQYRLADPGDGHVAHAAIVGKADAIVTNDSRAGFATAPSLIEAEIQSITPAQFAANTVAAHPESGVRAVQAMSARMTTPPRTPAQVLDELRQRYGMTEVHHILAPLLAEDDVTPS